jgi:putative membrane protein
MIVDMKKIGKYFPLFLLIIYLILLIRSWINPVDRGVRYAEEWTVLLVVLVLIFTFKKFRFSNLAYFMMFLWIIIHTVWWHYTFENVPFDWFNNLFWFERNMYDRVGHFIIWFYAFPIIELLDRKNMVNNKVILYLFWFLFMVSLAWLYEIFERWYAVYFDPATWDAVLWSQWDIWDAQKDMLMDTCGAMFAIIVYVLNSKLCNNSK